MPRLVKGPDGKTQSFPDDATDAEISAALEAIPSVNAKSAPKARTWTDTAIDALPAVGSVVGGAVGATGGPLTGVAGAGVGGMVGDALKQAANKLRGETVPETVTGALSEMVGEAATSAAVAAPFAAGGAVLRAAAPSLERGGLALAKAATEVEGSGGDALRSMLRGKIYKGIKEMILPPTAKAVGNGMAATGRAFGSAAEKIPADMAEQLADDVMLVRDHISMGWAPKTALKVIAEKGAEGYGDVLEKAYIQSVKSAGLPPPEAVMKILKLPAFQKLPQP